MFLADGAFLSLSINPSKYSRNMTAELDQPDYNCIAMNKWDWMKCHWSNLQFKKKKKRKKGIFIIIFTQVLFKHIQITEQDEKSLHLFICFEI